MPTKRLLSVLAMLARGKAPRSMVVAAALALGLHAAGARLGLSLINADPLDAKLELRTHLFERTLTAPGDAVVVLQAPTPSPEEQRAAQAAEQERAALVALHEQFDRLLSQLDTGGVSIERPCLDGKEDACTRRALDALLDKMVDTARGTATTPVRWSQFGDSLTAWALLVGEFRRLTQAQFGNAGHGFVFLGNPMRGGFEQQSGIEMTHGSFSVRSALFHEDPAFGLSGTSFRALDRSWTRIVPTDLDSQSLGRIGMLFQSESEQATVRVTTETGARVHAIAATPGEPALHWIEVPNSRDVKLDQFDTSTAWHGVLTDHDGPGFVVDNLGLVRGRIGHLRKIANWSAQLSLRDPDIVAFFYGAVTGRDQDPAFLRDPDAAWRNALREDSQAVYRAARQALPDRDCIVLGHLTRGERTRNGIVEVAQTRITVDLQREAALAEGCAFWDSNALVSSTGGPAAWHDATPPLLGQDLRHLRPDGSTKVARHLYATLLEALVARLEERIGQQGP